MAGVAMRRTSRAADDSVPHLPSPCLWSFPSKVAWAEPSERWIVPNVPVTPAAVTGPCTGGQFCAHVPLQFDLVGVSGRMSGA